MKQSKKLIALLLTLVMVLTFIPVNVARAAIAEDTTLTISGSWEVGEKTVTSDISGNPITLSAEEVITLTNFDSETMEAVLHASDGFEAFLVVDANGKTSLSTANNNGAPVDGLPTEATVELLVRAKNTNSGGNNDNSEEAKIVFHDINQIAFDNGTSTATITYQNAQNENVTVTVTPAQGTTLTSRTEQQYDENDQPNGVKDVLITNGGAVNIAFTAEPLNASYNVFINGQSQGDPTQFTINDNNATTLDTVVGNEYEVCLDFAGNGGGDPQPGGNKTAKITISGMDLNGKETWTGIPSTGHEEETTYYNRFWTVVSFSINENGERTNTTDYKKDATDEELAEYSTQSPVRFVEEEGATKVDINVFINWGDRIDAIWINGVDYSAQLHVDADLNKDNIFDDDASLLRLFKDQGINLTITDVPVNKCDEDGIDEEYNIQIAASPNPKCFIGNFLWTQDDYFAPYDQGGIEPNDMYIGKSELTLMDIYYYDGTFDQNEAQNESDGFVQLDGIWYKHINVPEGSTEYTDRDLPAIHYQLNREGEAITKEINGARTNVVTSEMVMPIGTWVKMRIQPEQGYQVESFSGVNRNAGNVRILSDNNDDACVFMFKIDSGNFHIGANVVPYDNTINAVSEDVTGGAIEMPEETIDGGTAELKIDDADINDADVQAFEDAAGDYTLDTCLDISLNEVYLKGGVQDDNQSEAWALEAEPKNPVTISLYLNNGIELEGKDVQIVHYNDHGDTPEYEVLSIDSYDPDNNMITFEAKSFSEYAIVSKEVTAPAGNKAILNINTTTGALSGGNAVFTYKDGEEVVGTVRTDDAAAVEPEKDGAVTVSQHMYVTDSSVSFELEPVSGDYKPQVCKDGTWEDIVADADGKYIYTLDGLSLSEDGNPVTDVQFAFICTKTYNVKFTTPVLTIGEDEQAITASVVRVGDREDQIDENTIINGIGAKEIIELSGYDPNNMIVRITADGDTTSWSKVLVPTESIDAYVLSLGVINDIPDGCDTLLFELVPVQNGGNDPGPNDGRIRLVFRDAVDIAMDDETKIVTVTYKDDEDQDVFVTITADDGVIDGVNVNEWNNPDDGASGTNYELLTKGGVVSITLPDEPEYTQAWYDIVEDGQPGEAVDLTFENNITSINTEIGKQYDVGLSFRNDGPEPHPEGNTSAIIELRGADGYYSKVYYDENGDEVGGEDIYYADTFLGTDISINDSYMADLRYNDGENMAVDTEYSYDANDGDDTVAITLLTMWNEYLYDVVEINGNEYTVSDYIDYTDREEWLKSFSRGGDLHLSFTIPGVPRPETDEDNPEELYQITVKKRDDGPKFASVFLWTADPDQQYAVEIDEFGRVIRDENDEPIYILDEDGNKIPGKNYIGHSRLELVKAEYSVGDYDCTITKDDIREGITEDGDYSSPDGYLMYSSNPDLTFDDGVIIVPEGAIITMRVVPDYGYQVVGVNDGGEFITTDDGVCEFTIEMPEGGGYFLADVEAVEDEVIAGTDTVEEGTIEIGDASKIEGGTLRLSVDDVELSSDKIANFEKAAGDYTISSYLDINLNQVFYKGTADDVWANQIDELDTEATITLKLAEGVTADDIVIVHNVHNGDTFEIIEIDSYDSETNTITFKTKSFSDFAIAEKAKYKSEWVNGLWYDENGKQTYSPKASWKKNSTGWWYEDTSGWYPKNQLQKIDGDWYYFKADGYMAANEWYNGYWLDSNGKWTYKAKGSWKKNSSGWWYEDTNGKYPKNQLLSIDGNCYYFKADGYMATNEWYNGYWLDSNGKWTYKAKGSWKKNSSGWWYEDTNGWYPKNQLQKIDGNWYYFKADGYMAVNEWYNGFWLDSDGKWTYKAKGSWKKNSTGWWYEDTNGWYPKNQWQKIDGVDYHFDSNGYWDK